MSFKKQSFVKGALVLTVAGFGVKFIGAIFRIVLAAVIADEGIGLYQMAYPIYTTLLTISTAGIPIAVSKLVAENLAKDNYYGAQQVFRVSFVILATTGLLVSLLLLLGAGWFVEHIVKDPRAYFPLIAISPAIFLVTIMSAFRGYFQGQQFMIPTAMSQVVEQIGRVLVSILLVIILMPYGLEYAAGGATFGAAAGAGFGLTLLLALFIRQRSYFRHKIEKNGKKGYLGMREIMYSILVLAIPITLGNLVLPLINMIDLMVVPMRLHSAGFDVNRATALYGQLSGMANPILHIPTILTISLSISLVPAISEAFSVQDSELIKERSSLAIRLTLLMGLPSAIGLFLLAVPISDMLYNNPEAGIPLAIMSFGVIFVTVQQTTAGILQGLGKTFIPVVALLVGASFKLVLSWILTAMPTINIRGAALATVVGFFVAGAINYKKVTDYTGMSLDIKKAILKPVFSVIFMAIGVYFTYGTMFSYLLSSGLAGSSMTNNLATVAAIFVGTILYTLALFLTGALDRRDLEMIPRIGHRLARIATSLKLLK